jgi:hypothetical protein
MCFFFLFFVYQNNFNFLDFRDFLQSQIIGYYNRRPDSQNLKIFIFIQKMRIEYKNIKYIKSLYFLIYKIFISQRFLKSF